MTLFLPSEETDMTDAKSAREAVARAMWDVNGSDCSYDEAVQGQNQETSEGRSHISAVAWIHEMADAAISAINGNKSTDKVVIYTDGACSGNPGPGGWGAYILWGDQKHELCSGHEHTTNNRMELLATIEALVHVRDSLDLGRSKIEIFTDSSYVKDGITQWIKGWKARGWMTAGKQPVKNSVLWKELDELNESLDVTWSWVKGHNGDPGNEKADELARKGMAPYKK